MRARRQTGTLPISAQSQDKSAANFARNTRLAAAVATFTALGIDIGLKKLMLSHAANWNDKVVVPGLLDTHYVFNRGISFSLFWQSSTFGSAALGALQIMFVLLLGVAAWRARKPAMAVGLGLIAGGALGNIADRLGMGTVFDFLVVRLASLPLFVCNSADIFISLGVSLLVAELLFESQAHQQTS